MHAWLHTSNWLSFYRSSFSLCTYWTNKSVFNYICFFGGRKKFQLDYEQLYGGGGGTTLTHTLNTILWLIFIISSEMQLICRCLNVTLKHLKRSDIVKINHISFECFLCSQQQQQHHHKCVHFYAFVLELLGNKSCQWIMFPSYFLCVVAVTMMMMVVLVLVVCVYTCFRFL